MCAKIYIVIYHHKRPVTGHVKKSSLNLAKNTNRELSDLPRALLPRRVLIVSHCGHLGARQCLVQVERGTERTVQKEPDGVGGALTLCFPELRAFCGDAHSNSCGSGKVFLCPQELAGWPPPLASSEALGEQGAAKGPAPRATWRALPGRRDCVLVREAAASAEPQHQSQATCHHEPSSVPCNSSSWSACPGEHQRP